MHQEQKLDKELSGCLGEEYLMSFFSHYLKRIHSAFLKAFLQVLSGNSSFRSR